MKAQPYYFEIKDMIAQFIAAFDDIVINRYNKQRSVEDQIEVRYLYAPKQRVMHDIINENKTLTLPAVAVSIGGITRDEDRVFNKIEGFYYSTSSETGRFSKHIKSPVPINLTLKVSLISRYQTDIDQIISNFVPFCNPYVIISWKVPDEFELDEDQEIRSEVLWDGSISMSYPKELNASQKAHVTADTTFTIKGWLFKDDADPAGNIFFIDTNFSAVSAIEDYDTMEALDNPTESFELSGIPIVTNVVYGDYVAYGPITVSESLTSLELRLLGYNFDYTDNILLSSANGVLSSTIVDGFTRQGAITGIPIEYVITADTLATVILPLSTELYDVPLTFVPYNTAGYSVSDPLTATLSG